MSQGAYQTAMVIDGDVLIWHIIGIHMVTGMESDEG